ncbi:MAG: glycoside hydrolase family 16 protein [Prevotella sp.]|jgi:beta-glucanase (GH16 family)
MKTKFITLLVFFFVLSASVFGIMQAQGTDEQNNLVDNKYTLVFSDEFDGTDGSWPDNSKWVCSTRYNSGWNRWISKSNKVAFIKNGKLICRAIPNTSASSDTAQMLTGSIETLGKFSFQYGKVEVRMKTNNLQGNFPAVWMKPVEGNVGHDYGEIDIVEGCGNLGAAQQTVHSKLNVTLKKKYKKNSFRTSVAMNKWHVYGMEWTPTSITFTIDGKVTGTYEKATDKSVLAEGQWTFDRPFYLIVNQSVGDGNTESMVPKTNRRYETQFDWIRVYRLDN